MALSLPNESREFRAGAIFLTLCKSDRFRSGSEINTIQSMGLTGWMIRQVNFQNLYVSVGVIFPVFDGKFSTNMDINRAPSIVGFDVI